MTAARGDRWARRLVGLYPHAWRARYQDEVLALIDETGLSVGQALDLARGALVERLRILCDAILTYLGQTSLERLTDRSGLARFGPIPTAVLAAVVAVPLQLLSAAIGDVLAQPWPTHSTTRDVWITLPFQICMLGLARLAFLRPRRGSPPLVVESLPAGDVPQLNRWAAFFWRAEPARPRPVYRPRHALMRPLEGAAWIGLAVTARALMGWVCVIDHPAAFTTWSLSFEAGLFITALATAVARGRRFRSPSRP